MFLEALKKMAVQDWWLLVILGLWSLAALTIVLERLHFLWDILARSEEFKLKVVAALERGERQTAQALCEASNVPLAVVFARGFEVARRQPAAVPEAVALRRTAVVQTLRRYLWALGTISASAPFVGLFGTVVGIINAFRAMAQSGSGGLGSVSAGIAEALVTTAFGLLVAIPAVWIYNYFQTKIDFLTVEMTYSGKELIDYLIKNVGSEFGRSSFTKDFPAQVASGSGHINK